MPTFRAPRGTRDLLPPETATWTRLERLAADLAARYGYRRIETPMLELTDVFERGVGEVTDIVEKELFRLAPRTEDGEAWALRPEPTAGIVRAYIQHGMQTWPQPVKLSEIGPMFRYDRPQAGRYRQFWQFDIEAIGDAGPAIDAEIIELGSRFYREAGLDGVVVHLNSIGDAACRPAYVAELTDVLPGARSRAARARARPARAQRPAPPRFERSGDGRPQRGGPDDHRPPVRRRAPSTSPASGRTSMSSSCHTGSSPGSFAGSTTTPGPPSSSTSPVARASSRRSAAAGGTTVWSSSSVGDRRPASGSGSGSTG